MSLREDVLELLRLYEGKKSRDTSKPTQSEMAEAHPMPRLWFRSQVPERLREAYDIALNDGLVQQYILEKEDQLGWHRRHEQLCGPTGLTEVPQDQPSSVVPASADALVELTAKGLAAISSSS